MERISHRELRNRSGEVLRRVQAGESMEITNNGVVVANISPAQPQVTQVGVGVRLISARKPFVSADVPNLSLEKSEGMLEALLEDRYGA